MNRAVRRATITVASAATEGLDMVTVVIGGAIGAWAGYTYYPDTWSGDWRLAVTGAVAVVAAVAVNGLADLFLTPLHRLVSKARYNQPQTSGFTAPAVPDTLDEGLAQVVAASEDDAAHRASSAAFHIDRGENFLRDENRWRGYEDGEASFYLAPGVCLHYASTEAKYGTRDHDFTLLTGDGDEPVAISSIDQIRHHLTARVAGLPASPVTAADTSEDRDDLMEDLTGLHAI
ncbi:hypothetical protein QFZ56_000048 [Streptomyces achromogenes]|uniref:Uncharacterized protein n=1 Tax=Streptomyces achromogenes TaxID=67255 RepID=A0ABU0PRU7_STRAH|nr:hypothetical protein [Streptomyces achromogenes]MDQ0681085.1 hypothetical protein [Streptomyces achromogenes]